MEGFRGMKKYSLNICTEEGIPIYTIVNNLSEDAMKTYLLFLRSRFSLDPIESYELLRKWAEEKGIFVVDMETGERIRPEDFLLR